MLDLTNAKIALKFKLPPDKAYDEEGLTWALQEGANKVWRARPWKFAERRRGQIDTVANYTTGYVYTVANLGTTVTGDGTSWDASMIGRHIRIGSDIRDYEITAVGSSTSLTIKDPYEGTAITTTDTTYKIRKKLYYLPYDYASGFAFKESQGRRWIGLTPRQEFEMSQTDPNQEGEAEVVVEAGFSYAAMYSAGTVSLSPGSATVTGTSTAFDSRMKNVMFVVDGFPARFGIESVNSGTSLTLDRPWPYEAQTLATYQIAPAGSPMIELYPIHNYNGSIEIFYYRKSPEFNKGSDRPQWYEDMHDIWLDAALNQLGIVPDEYLEKRIGELAERDGYEREGFYEMQAPGGKGISKDYVGSQGARIFWGSF